MAVIPDNTNLAMTIGGALDKVTHAVTEFVAPPPHSAEHDLLKGPIRDARLAPRVPMSNAELDAGLLAQLSNYGFKRGKQVTAESHPELMQAWSLMSQRAGLAQPPQLLIVESPILNALTVNRSEVVLTTALLKTLDLNETVAFLGHELGHVQNDHTTPRVLWTGVLGGLGGLAGNEFGRHGGANTLLHAIGKKLPFIEKLRGLMYPTPFVQKASSLLGYSAYIGLGATVGTVLARNVSVRTTEHDADAKGAAISGDPLSMAAGLRVVEHMAHRSAFANIKGRLRAGYPSTSERIARLERMAREQPMTPVMTQVQIAPPAAAIASQEPRFAVNSVASAERLADTQAPAIT